MFFIHIFLLIVAVITLILIAKIEVRIRIQGTDIRLRIVIFGVISIKRHLKLKREKGKLFSLYLLTKKKSERINSLYDIIKKARQSELFDRQKYARKKAVRFILKRTDIRIHAQVTIGAGDAYCTAMLCGLIKTAVGIAGAVLMRRNHAFQFHTKPVFSGQAFSIGANCIIALSPANIILGYILYKLNTRR